MTSVLAPLARRYRLQTRRLPSLRARFAPAPLSPGAAGNTATLVLATLPRRRQTRWVGAAKSNRSRVADEAAFAPLVIVEQLRPGQQHPYVVGPGREHLVALVLGLLDELAQPTARVGAEVGADAVRRVDVQAVQGDPAGRAGRVHREVEQRAHEPVRR